MKRIKSRKSKILRGCFLGGALLMLIGRFLLFFTALAGTHAWTSQEMRGLQLTTQQSLQNSSVRPWVQSLQEGIPKNSDPENRLSGHRRNAMMIFVSFSMSKASLQRYFGDAQKIHGALVLRGFVQNSLVSTAQKVHEIIQQHRGGFSIDPIVYEKLSITQVPAIALFDSAALHCLNQPHCIPDPSDYDIVYGQVTLPYALSLFAEKKNVLTPVAEGLLKSWRADFYE